MFRTALAYSVPNIARITTIFGVYQSAVAGQMEPRCSHRVIPTDNKILGMFIEVLFL